MTTFSSVLAFAGMPFNLWLYSKIWIDETEQYSLIIPYSSIMKTLVLITIPAGVGMVVRHYNQKAAILISKVYHITSYTGGSFKREGI